MKLASIAGGKITIEMDKYDLVAAYADNYEVCSKSSQSWPRLDEIVAEHYGVSFSEARQIWHDQVVRLGRETATFHIFEDLFVGNISLNKAAELLLMQPYELEAWLGQGVEMFTKWDVADVARNFIENAEHA